METLPYHPGALPYGWNILRPSSSGSASILFPCHTCKAIPCAITALLCWQPRQLSLVSPLLTLPSGQLLRQAAFQARLWTILQSCGLDANSYTGHSLRCGAATTIFQAGLPGEIIQLLGDRRSDAYKLYLTVDLNSKFTFLGPWLNFLKQHQITTS